MTNDTLYIRVESENLLTSSRLEKIIRSMDGFALVTERDTADLLILDLGKNIETNLKTLEALSDSGRSVDVFLTAEKVNPELLLKAMRSGVKEFFSQPLREEEVKQALGKFRECKQSTNRNVSCKSGLIMPVIGSKGGIGATTICVNLATMLAEKGNQRSIALMDLNMGFGEIPLFLNLEPRHHWGEIYKNIDRLDATFLMNVLTKHPSGVYVLPAPNFVNSHPPQTPEMNLRLLTLMRNMFDMVIIDAGRALNENTLKLLDLSRTSLLVSALTLPCLANSKRFLSGFANLGYNFKERIKLVINRHEKKSDISLEEAEKSLDMKVFWTIPNDYKNTLAAIHQGKPLNRIAPKALATRRLDKLADRLLPTEQPKKKKWRFIRC